MIHMNAFPTDIIDKNWDMSMLINNDLKID